MTTLYVIASLHRSARIATQALAAWRTDSEPRILHLNCSDRMMVLLRLIGNANIQLSKDCFAIDADDESAWADFNAFLHALRAYERVGTVAPSVIRSFSCRL